MSDLIAPHLASLRARGRSPLTVHSREGCLRRLARDLPKPLDKASTEELELWLGQPGWTTKTRETYWCHIVGFFRWAARPGRNQRIDWDPSEDLARPAPRPGKPRVATDDQLHRCLDLLVRPALRVVRRAVILAAGAGMRASEIAAADREDFTARRVLILGKGEKGRAVPLIPDVWKEVVDEPPGRLITNRGRPVDGFWVTRTCAKALARIGEPRLTIHWFRGAFATRLRRSGVDIAAISRLLGHSSVATTQRYLEMLDEDLELAVARLPGLHEPAGSKRVDGKSEPVSTRLRPPATEAA